MEKSVGAFLAALLLIGIGGAGVVAYRGVFYVTGSQYYEACWERRAKENKIGGFFKEAEADNPSQAVLWASCTPIMLESMENAKFGLGSSNPNAPADIKALASVCPDTHDEMPLIPSFWYIVIVDAIEKNGGPSLIDRVAPAGWLVQRAAKARWPGCIDATRPYLAKARKDVTPVTQ
jgi:hypothetical protein